MGTPRTDDLLLKLYGTERVEAEKIVNEFARQLERECNEALACPRQQIMMEQACKNRKQCWEPCGDLGHHEEYAKAQS